MRPVQRIAAVAAIGLGFTGLGPAVTAARPWDVDRHARPDALRRITQDRAPASLAALAAGDQQPAADEDIGLPLFLPYGASGHILRYAVATSRPPTAEPEPTDARTRVPTAPAPGTPWIITATPGPTQTPWVVTATPAGERTNTPRPTGADITNTPRPTEMERTNTPRPTEADRTATPRPTEADRTATPQPTGSDRTATPRPRQTEFYPTPTPIFTGPVAPAQGPRLFKSGPLQITADGRWLWVADAHSNSVISSSGRRTNCRTSRATASNRWPDR